MNFINLNLLTLEHKKELRLEVALLIVKDVFSLFLVVASVIAIMFISSKIILRNNYQEFVAASQLIEKQNPEFQQRILKINQETEALAGLQKQWLPIHYYLEELSRVVKDPTTLTILGFDSQGEVIHISGHALTRDSVLELQKELENLTFVDEVRSPITNILRPRDVEFIFEIFLK